jgi:hypothetical protein
MKKLLLASLPLIAASYSYAQNTFTNTGSNVGIGTTNPTTALQIVRGGTNATNDYPSLQITTNANGNIHGPILYLNGLSGNNGRMWGLVSSGSLDAPGTGASGNFAIYDTQAGSRFVINAAGNIGIGTLSPSSYYHGGNNRALEISNPNTAINSQSHLILSTASVASNSSVGTISWMSKGSTGNQGIAYINGTTKGDITNNASGEIVFATANNNTPVERMRISSTGNLLIGQASQANLNYKLDVVGSMRANEIVVNSTGADFVFSNTYKLRTLSSLNSFIRTHHHLPEIPSAIQMQSQGMEVGEMNKKLLQKVEELTLYLIDLQQQNRSLQQRVQKLENKK